MENKKKILVFHTKVAPYRVDFFNSLAEHYEMFMCMDNKHVYGGLYSDIEKEYKFDYKKEDVSNNIISAIKIVNRLLKTNNPDIVMVSECGLISLLVVLFKYIYRKKYAIVSIIDDSYDMLINGKQFSKRHVFAEKLLIPRFDNIINVEPRVVNYFQKKYGKGIYFPIIRDEILYRKELEKSLSISEKYKQQYQLEGKQVILFVGRFVSLKNIPTLINAVQSIENKNVKLVLVGAGPEEQVCRYLADKRVIFTGKLSGKYLYAWYNIASVFVLPSFQEPFGAVVNEALMAGCHCVVSEKAGSTCLIDNCVNGYVFNPSNKNELKNHIESLLKIDISIGSKIIVKPCLMQISYQQAINKVFNKLDMLA